MIPVQYIKAQQQNRTVPVQQNCTKRMAKNGAILVVVFWPREQLELELGYWNWKNRVLKTIYEHVYLWLTRCGFNRSDFA